MRALNWAVVQLIVAVGLSAACAPIRFTSQDVLIRHDAKNDVLDFLLLYDEIQTAPQSTGGDARSLDTAKKFVSHVVLGKREFMIFDWPLHWDLDPIPPDMSEEGPWADLRHEVIDLVGGISLERSGLFRGEHERLSLFQHFKIKSAGRLIALANRSLYLWIEDCVREQRFEQETPFFDAQTRVMWIELAKKTEPWLTLQDGAIRAVLPMTSASRARLLASMLSSSGEDKTTARILACLASSLTDITMASDHVSMAWTPKEGLLTLRYSADGEYNPALSSALAASRDVPKDLPTRSDVIARFQAP